MTAGEGGAAAERRRRRRRRRETAGPPIDAAAFANLLEMTGGDIEFVDDLVDTYLEEGDSLIDRLRTAAAAGDGATDDLLRAAHSLKSSSLNVGALPLGELCRALEADARGGPVAGPPGGARRRDRVRVPSRTPRRTGPARTPAEGDAPGRARSGGGRAHSPDPVASPECASSGQSIFVSTPVAGSIETKSSRRRPTG